MKHQQQGKIKITPLLMVFALVVISLPSAVYMGNANAANFQEAFVRLDTLKATTATGGRVCAQPSTVATEASVNVMFPTTAATDYVVNTTATNWTVTTTGLDAGQTAWPGIGTATAVSGKTVTFPSGELTVGTLYCFNFSGTSTLTTSSAGANENTKGTITTRTSAPATIDSTTYSQSIITNDQVVVNAVVPPSFSFVLSANADPFLSDLSTTTITSTAGQTVTINTNAASGWIVWVKDLNNNGSGRGSLRSATSLHNIPGSVAPGAASRTINIAGGHPEDFGLGVTVADAAAGGTATANAFYEGSANKIGTLDPTQFRPIASSTGTANGDVITLTPRAIVTGQTPAASDYTDTMTVIGAGVF